MSAHRHQTQAEANTYWSDKDYKKWVVEFVRGPSYRRQQSVVYVGSCSREGARKAGIKAMQLLGRRWAAGAAISVRLATAYDLGCTYVEKARWAADAMPWNAARAWRSGAFCACTTGAWCLLRASA